MIGPDSNVALLTISLLFLSLPLHFYLIIHTKSRKVSTKNPEIFAPRLRPRQVLKVETFKQPIPKRIGLEIGLDTETGLETYITDSWQTDVRRSVMQF